MSRMKFLALAVLAIVVPFLLAFTAFNLSRTIGGPSVPPVPGLVHQESGKTEASKDDANEGSGRGTATNDGAGSPGSQVNPSPTDDHGGRGSDGSDSSGPGGGDDSSHSGSSGSDSGPGGSGPGGSGDD
jgi:hypothetical protein